MNTDSDKPDVPADDAPADAEANAPLENAPAENVVEAAVNASEPDTDESPVDESPLSDADEEADEEEDDDADVEPLELNLEEEQEENLNYEWYILKVQVNRETSIRDTLERRVKMHQLEEYFKEIVVPTEDVAEFTKAGKRRIVKKKLFPGYIMVHMAITDDTWFLVRETSGIGDFTGAAGKPSPMDPAEVEKIIRKPDETDDGELEPKAAIPFNVEDRVRVKDGNFQNFEGEVESVDETHGRVTVIINIFGRPTPVELEHWQIESI